MTALKSRENRRPTFGRLCTLLVAGLVPLLVQCGEVGEPAGDDYSRSLEAALELGPSPNGVYIVVLDFGSPESVAASVGATPERVYRHALNGFAANLSTPAIAALLSNPRVRFVQPDREVRAVAQTLPTGVDRIDADRNAFAGIGSGGQVDVNVAVLDTGIDPNHPDLNVVFRSNCARRGPTNNVCADGEGSDGYGHGTHVAGTIGALDNDTGVVGVAPGANLFAVKVLGDNGSGWLSWIVAGIDRVTATRTDGDPSNDVAVANMSLGGGGSDDTDGGDCHASNDAENLAICNAADHGIVFVVAAGNESDDAANHTPAAYDQVITVSALADFDGQPGGLSDNTVVFSSCTEDRDDSFACFSNYGPDVDVIAPGVSILSTYPGGGLATMSGTSMASPHVAGAAALYVAENGIATDRAGVDAIRVALTSGGVAAPCADTPSGVCAEDPDSIQEPMVYVGDACSSDADCDDGDACNGLETCNVDSECVPGTPVDCDDGDACTTVSCNPADGSCNAPDPIFCDDGNDCTDDSCDSGTGCVFLADDTNSCSDGDACTDPDFCSGGACQPGALVCEPPPTCGGNKAACSVNSDCCSGNCRDGSCRGN